VALHGFSHRMTDLFRAAALYALAALTAACAGTVRQPAAEVPHQSPPPPAVPDAPPQPPVHRETGTASWYGRDFHGKKTASGEVFDMHGLSAAHLLLPFGAVVLVTNPENSKSVTVKINDRGPFVKGRLLELSYGAARELGFAEKGAARVELETAKPARGRVRYTVQAATYAEMENARMLKERLSGKYGLIYIRPFETNVARFYRVRVGSYASLRLAEKVAERLALEGLEPFVLRKE